MLLLLALQRLRSTYGRRRVVGAGESHDGIGVDADAILSLIRRRIRLILGLLLLCLRLWLLLLVLLLVLLLLLLLLLCLLLLLLRLLVHANADQLGTEGTLAWRRGGNGEAAFRAQDSLEGTEALVDVVEALVDDLVYALVDDGSKSGGQRAQQVRWVGVRMYMCLCLCLGLGLGLCLGLCLSVGVNSVGVRMMDADGGVGGRVNVWVDVDVHVRVGHEEGLVVVDGVAVWVRHRPEVSKAPSAPAIVASTGRN